MSSDVVDALRADHGSIGRLFERFTRLDGQDRSEWFEHLRSVLVRHEAAEDLAVYPALRGASADQDQILDDRIAEEAMAHDLIASLETVQTGTEEFRRGISRLRRATLAHIEQEELSILLLIEQGKTSSERSEMFQQYERAKNPP